MAKAVLIRQQTKNLLACSLKPGRATEAEISAVVCEHGEIRFSLPNLVKAIPIPQVNDLIFRGIFHDLVRDVLHRCDIPSNGQFNMHAIVIKDAKLEL
jgi:hypothetical protein